MLLQCRLGAENALHLENIWQLFVLLYYTGNSTVTVPSELSFLVEA